MDRTGGEAARRMLDELRRRGVDETILAAFAAVPRGAFVERFRAAPPGRPRRPGELREWVVGRDPGAEDLVHDPDLALVTAGEGGGGSATSSLSAPHLVAGMLAELDLAPGLRVLEIGAGSGWHAALMAALVGDPSLVTTVDIDADLVAATRARLAARDLGAIEVVCADGAGGHPPGAPFDRIVATVGCTDLAPAWTAQLAPGGRLLVPLVHGGIHPRVLLAPGDGDGVVEGRFTGPSGFVGIQGAQAHGSPWPAPGPPPPPGDLPAPLPLPADLADALDPGGEEPAPRPFALGLYLALRDRRAAPWATLVRDGAAAAVDPSGLLVIGEADDLVADLLTLAGDWVAAGPG
jgi:protein-L-isoaspartate(D-aspartate) O-methyltransferase